MPIPARHATRRILPMPAASALLLALATTLAGPAAMSPTATHSVRVLTPAAALKASRAALQ